jgi:hypothetical protein
VGLFQRGKLQVIGIFYATIGFTLLITLYFYNNKVIMIASFGKNVYIITGCLLIISGFISQRYLERRLLIHWNKIKGITSV